MCAAEHGHTECAQLLLQPEWVGDKDVQDDVRLIMICNLRTRIRDHPIVNLVILVLQLQVLLWFRSKLIVKYHFKIIYCNQYER